MNIDRARARRHLFTALALLTLPMTVTAGQHSTLRSSDARAFIGTWVFAMANPAGAEETVKIWDDTGTLAASVQSERFPPIGVSGILKDGDMLVLTATRFENGKPDRAVISLTPEGDTMKMAQMLEFSETIKHGTGKKQQTEQSQSAGSQPNDDEQFLKDTEQRLARAWSQHDRPFIEGVLAPEWVVTQADGTMLTRSVVLGTFFDAVQFDSNLIDDVTVALIGDTAVVRGRTAASAKVNGAPVNARIRFTDVFLRRDGRWQVVASHASSLAQ